MEINEYERIANGLSEEQKMFYHLMKTAETVQEYIRLGWPEPEGTDKQKTWAMQIKIQSIKELDRMESNFYIEQYGSYDEEFYNKIMKPNDMEVLKNFLSDVFINYCHDSAYLIRNNRRVKPIFIMEYVSKLWKAGKIENIEKYNLV